MSAGIVGISEDLERINNSVKREMNHFLKFKKMKDIKNILNGGSLNESAPEAIASEFYQDVVKGIREIEKNPQLKAMAPKAIQTAHKQALDIALLLEDLRAEQKVVDRELVETFVESSQPSESKSVKVASRHRINAIGAIFAFALAGMGTFASRFQ